MKNLFPLFFIAASVCAQDVIHYTDGSVRNVKISAAEGSSLRIVIPPPFPGASEGSAVIPRANISKIVFGPDPVLDAVAAAPVAGSVASARSRWQNLKPFLGTPESRAAEAGCLLGEILLQADDAAHREEALSIFNEVENGAWKVEDRQRAARGRLGVMIKEGKLEEASRQAEEMERTVGDPELIIDTRLLLARARLEELKKLIAENPRWDEDPPMRAERERLANEGLDFALYPFLFHGTKHRQAAEGLWIANELYVTCDDADRARETLNDIVEIYPDTSFAAEAKSALAKTGGKSAPNEKSAPASDE